MLPFAGRRMFNNRASSATRLVMNLLRSCSFISNHESDRLVPRLYSMMMYSVPAGLSADVE